MTNVVPDEMPDDSPRDALPVDAFDWEEVPAESEEDLVELDLKLDELEPVEFEPDELEANELELDESAILNEEPDDLLLVDPKPRSADEDYTIHHEEHPRTWPDAHEEARLRMSYYETWREPLESIDQELLEFQQEASAASNQTARPTLPLPDQVHAQIQQKLYQQNVQRLSLGDLFGFTTLVAVVLAAASWLPLNLYTLLLGCVTFGLLITILKRNKPGRYIWVSLITLLVIYIGSIIITIIRLESPPS